MDIMHENGASPGPSTIKPTQTDVASSSSSFVNADLPSGSDSNRGIDETTYTDDVTMATPPNLAVSLPAMANEAGSKGTPVKNKHLMDGYTHHSAAVTKDSVLGYAQTAAVNGFEDHYLREANAIQTTEWGQYKVDFLRKLQGATREKQMYSPIIKLLTKISLFVCKDNRCLAFYDTSDKGCPDNFEGSNLRPDIVAKWTTHVDAEEIVREDIKAPVVYWHETQSLVEVKQNFGSLPPSNQAGQYLHVLPRGLPSLAGMLYLASDKFKFYIYWSDTSGIVRSHHYDITEEKSWDVLFRYVLTVVEPLENLPTWDPTMTINVENPLEPKWVIASNEKAHPASLLYAMNGHSRQTSVFWSEEKKRIIKDQWRDDDRRFNESEILERIKGVPGVAQVDYSEVVKGSDDEPLTTSDLHSGAECVLEFEYNRRVPKRTKQRNVLKTKGDSLSKRTSVLQLAMAVFDSVQGHQICVDEKEVMHRDVSKNNIVINPVHYDTKLDDIPKAKYINQILNPKAEQFKEEGALIDWDNAACLNESVVGDALTDRTGTPMFVSISVGIGAIRYNNRHKENFPRLEGEAKHLYIQAFGQEKYDEYIEAVEKAADSIKKSEVKAFSYKHSPFHDIESFFWVLVYELLLAWPEGEEECMTQAASSLILQFRNHSFLKNGADFRSDVLGRNKDFFEEVLHPRLWCLAEILATMAEYLYPEWAFWPDLPKDHVHEAFKRLLLAAIHILKSDPIRLRAEQRNPNQNPDAVRHTSHLDNKESASPTKTGSKRSHVDTGAQEEHFSKRTKGESGLLEAGGGDSRSSANIEGKVFPPSLPAVSGKGRGRKTTTGKQRMMLPPPAPKTAPNDEGSRRRPSAKGKGRMTFPTSTEPGQDRVTGDGGDEQTTVLRRSARLRTKSIDS
ncbi:hypothetical protein M0805_002544 [Coniferiporia weirii]|nr:hypothetical protein M0805_002544 [Coniferiporia weirii]